MRSKNIDLTYEMVKSVFNLPVPQQSELSNPFNSNTRRKNKLVTRKNLNEIPDNISDWSSRDFVNYFGDKYKQIFGGIYKKTYSSDCSKVNEFIEFMDANELNKNEMTKTFIDWCFDNNEFISRSNNTFSLTSMRKFLNTFFQQVVRNDVQSNVSLDIFNEVSEAIENGKTKEVLATYGIPIVSTYFINHKGIEFEKIKGGLNILFSKLIQGDQEELLLLNKIVQRSISRSPYPSNFEMLDWREVFSDLSNKYSKELWWRDKDYNGSMQYKYDRFLKE